MWPDEDKPDDNAPRTSELPAILRYTKTTAAVFAAMTAGLNALAAGAAYQRATELGWERPGLVVAMIVAALLGPASGALVAVQSRRWTLTGQERLGAVAFVSGFVALIVLIVVAGAVPS